MAGGKKNMFNELTRVQMPAMVHLTRLGYTYFGKITEDMAGTVYEPDTNILINVFKEQFARLNPTHAGEAEQTLKTIRQELDNDDIGRSFYERLSSVSPVRLVDFENSKNNTYHFTAEFTCKRDQDEFRPDITLFVNGLPLVFVEVKKPNNHGGMVAESKRMNQKRFPNKKFRRFLNITQLMIFSNNMEYDTMGGIVPVQGAFYCTTAKQSAPFNCFREENPTNLDIAPYNADFPYKDIDPIVEKKILTDFNCQVIHTSPEYQTNLDTYTPTNRVLTSMCSPERLLFILKYGIAYVRFHKEINGKIEFIEQKHIMRYQQMFAALTVRSKIDEGVNSGVIWHTQGSGKTALSYYLTYVLSDYFSKQNKVAKFYFIVDRLDLLKQASEEFEARGLVVKTASSRTELMEQFRNNQAQEGNTGKPEITVVNIQRFAEDRSKVDLPAYATNLQRVFIIDEAHRGYKPEGSFLANLLDADKNAIKIALTGTPLLKEERESWRVFGNYIHTYYYDKSILDGYTLKIIRGLITNNDVLRSEMQLTNDRLSLQETDNSLILVSQQLDILIGLDENLLLKPDTTLLDQTVSLETYEDYVAQAYSNDPAIRLLRKQTELAQNDIRLTKASSLPSLSLYASNTLARPVSRTLADMYNNNWNIGLSLSYPLSSLYKNNHKIKESKWMVSLHKNEEEQKKQKIRIEVRTAFLRHKEALQEVEALKLSVRQAQENYRIMQNRYLNQLAILTDLLDANSVLLNAELQLTNTRTHVIYTYYQLQKACGRL